MTKNIDHSLSELFTCHFNEPVISLSQIVNSGSNRKYYRILGSTHQAIGVYGANTNENETFIYFAQQFNNLRLPVPEVLCLSEDKTLYLTTDLGNTALLDYIDRLRPLSVFEEETIRVYKQVLDYLLEFQIKGGKSIDFKYCFADKKFDKKLILRDLNYCRYYFFKILNPDTNDLALEQDFDSLVNYISQAPSNYFMYRDFQARNILLQESEPYFIDFQGGMQGPLQYDLASLLYQAKAGLSEEIRTKLLSYYIEKLAHQAPEATIEFETYFKAFVCIRILQTLGAYGLRGLIEKKAHFIASIEPALQNARQALHTLSQHIQLPEIERCLQICAQSQIIKKMSEDKKLKVLVNSFSFKRGVPADHSGNGGGFVFDCRALPNPGKLDIYKPLTGMDQAVIEYLNAEPDVHEFIADAIRMVDKSVERYMHRGFTNLMVNFGCTGGRHRSVFCAEAMAKHLREKYDVKIELHHLEQERS